MLRGGDNAELKAVKRVVWLAVNVAYNLRLEVSYLNDRRACLVPSLLPSFSFSSTSETTVAAALAAAAATSAGKAALQQDEGDGVGDGDAAEGGGGDGRDDDDSDNSDDEYQDSSSVFAAAAAGNISADDMMERLLDVATRRRQGQAGAGSPEGVAGPEAPGGLDAAVPDRPGSDAGDEDGDEDGGDGDDDTASVLDQPPMLSSSLGVDFGDAPPFLQLHGGVNARALLGSRPAAEATLSGKNKSADKKAAATGGAPQEGSTTAMVSGSGGGVGRGYVFGSEHFAYQNQNMMITSLWMTQGTQCCNADLKFFQYYKHKHVGALPYTRPVPRCSRKAVLLPAVKLLTCASYSSSSLPAILAFRQADRITSRCCGIY